MIHDNLEKIHRQMVKEAVVGAVLSGLKLMGRTGKVIAKNPMRSVGAGFGANDLVSGTRSMSDAVSHGHNMAQNIGRITM